MDRPEPNAKNGCDADEETVAVKGGALNLKEDGQHALFFRSFFGGIFFAFGGLVMKFIILLSLIISSVSFSRDLKILDNYNTGDKKVVSFYVRLDDNNKIEKIFQKFTDSETGNLKTEFYSPEEVKSTGVVTNKRMGKEVVILSSRADDYTGGELSLSYMKSALSKKRGTFTMELVPNSTGFEIHKKGIKITNICFVLNKAMGSVIGIQDIAIGKCH